MRHETSKRFPVSVDKAVLQITQSSLKAGNYQCGSDLKTETSSIIEALTFSLLLSQAHSYRILATGTKKPGQHTEQEVQFLCFAVFSLSYSIFFFSFLSFVVFHSFHFVFCLVPTSFSNLPTLSASLTLPVTLFQPLSLSLILALPRLLLTQRTQTTRRFSSLVF